MAVWLGMLLVIIMVVWIGLKAGDDGELISRVLKLAACIATIGIMCGMIQLCNNVGVNDDMAECHSLGGTYSTESRKCYYAGEPNDIDELKRELGL